MLSQVPLKQLIQVLDVVWQGAVCVCVYVCVCACLISTYLYAYSYTIFDFYFRLLEMTLREPLRRLLGYFGSPYSAGDVFNREMK